MLAFLDILLISVLIFINLIIILVTYAISKTTLKEYYSSGSSVQAMNSTRWLENVQLIIFFISKPFLGYFIWRTLAKNAEVLGLSDARLLFAFIPVFYFLLLLYLLYYSTVVGIIMYKTLRVVRKIETPLLEYIIHSFAWMVLLFYFGFIPLVGASVVELFMPPLAADFFPDNRIINSVIPLLQFIIPLLIFRYISEHLSYIITVFLLKPQAVKNKELIELIKHLTNIHNCANIQIFEYTSKKERTANAYYQHNLHRPNKIYLSDYLVDNLKLDEIQAVLQHEIAHAKQYQKSKRVLGIPLTVIILYSVGVGLGIIAMIFPEGSVGYSLFSLASVTMMIFAFLFVFYDIINSMIRSKKEEEKADEYVIKSGTKPQVYISALQKLYSLNDYSSTLGKLEEKFSTHPSLENRIKYINEFAESLRKWKDVQKVSLHKTS